MKLAILKNALFVDNLFMCYVAAGVINPLPVGYFSVEIRTDGAKPRVHVDTLGWVGMNSDEHALLLGKVIGRSALIPCDGLVERLFNLVQAREDSGERVTLEIA